MIKANKDPLHLGGREQVVNKYVVRIGNTSDDGKHYENREATRLLEAGGFIFKSGGQEASDLSTDLRE